MKILSLSQLRDEVDELQEQRLKAIETPIVKQFRSWAVTTYGLEHLDRGVYEIPIKRLWENWPRHMSEKEWCNGFDFLMALHFARKHYKNRRPSIDPRLRYEVLKRDGFRCQLCGHSVRDSVDVKLEVDHRISRDDEGPTTYDNLWTLCRYCNRGKGTDSLYSVPPLGN